MSFRWDEVSLSDVRTLQDLDSDTGETPASSLELTALVKALTGTCHRNSSFLDTLSAYDSVRQCAAEKDFTRFVGAVPSPIFLSKMRLLDGTGVEPEIEKVLEALLSTSNQQRTGCFWPGSVPSMLTMRIARA